MLYAHSTLNSQQANATNKYSNDWIPHQIMILLLYSSLDTTSKNDFSLVSNRYSVFCKQCISNEDTSANIVGVF